MQWETAFVRALSDLDRLHIGLLERFTWTGNRLFGGDTPGLDQPVAALNDGQLKTVMPEFGDVLESLLATLQRHGLIEPLETAGPVLGGGRGPLTTWQITEFGTRFVERMQDVGERLVDAAELPDDSA
jgi:hypothetical protein